MEKQRMSAIAAITLTAILWGLSFISIKISVVVIPPMTLALARFLIASVMLWVILKVKEPITRLVRKDLPLMALGGFIGVTVYFYFENNGVKLTTASAASLIIATIPVLTMVGDYFFCGNKLSLTKMLSVFLSLVGVYLIVYENLQNAGSLTGDLFMFGACVAWVIYTLVTRPLSDRYSQLAVVTYQTIFGTITLIPFALLERSAWQPVDTVIFLNVLYLGIFCSALGYYLYVFAMDRLGVTVVSIFVNLIPVVAVTAGYFILQEPVTMPQITGGAVIIASVYLASWKRKSTEASLEISFKLGEQPAQEEVRG